MKHLNSFLILISLFFQPLTAQDSYQLQATVSKESMLSLSLVYTFPPPLSIQRNYPTGGEFDLTDANSLGIEGRVRYSHRIGKNFGWYASGAVGGYPHNYVLHLPPGFVDFPFNGPITIYGNVSTYLSLNFGGDILINFDKKRFVSAGFGVGAIYFPPKGPEGRGIPSFVSNGTFTTIPETEFYINPEKEIFFVPELSLRAYHRVGRRFLIHIGAMGVYSKKRPVEAKKFVIKTPNQDFQGSYSKQFAHPAIEFGVSMRVKRVPD